MKAKELLPASVLLSPKAEGGKADIGGREHDLLMEETLRVQEIKERREYYIGTQWDRRNAEAAACDNIDVEDLPEHERLLAYSTQIEECVNFMASQVGSQFQLEDIDEKEKELIETAIQNSPDLISDDSESASVVGVLREALVAGDIPVRVVWDPTIGEESGGPRYEFWESEAVEVRHSESDLHQVTSVILRETTWIQKDNTEVQVPKITVWYMQDGECCVSRQIDDELEPFVEATGLPFIPWTLLRGREGALRETRGTSVISRRSMQLANRYDENENYSFQIARQNSHSTMVVTGDAALLQNLKVNVIKKDVADFLTFPADTVATALSLPTDPEMIEHQRQVLLDSLYSAFGVTRVDQSTLQGIGNVTGYALEILNRKSEGTFGEVAKKFATDLKTLFAMTMDVAAYKQAQAEGDGDDVVLDWAIPLDITPVEELGDEYLAALQERREKILNLFNDVDPNAVYPDRDFRIRLGNGYIVDEVRVREDFNSKLISRREALRQRGYSVTQIDDIEDEIEAEAETVPEGPLSPAASSAATNLMVMNRMGGEGGIENQPQTGNRSGTSA